MHLNTWDYLLSRVSHWLWSRILYFFVVNRREKGCKRCWTRSSTELDPESEDSIRCGKRPWISTWEGPAIGHTPRHQIEQCSSFRWFWIKDRRLQFEQPVSRLGCPTPLDPSSGDFRLPCSRVSKSWWQFHIKKKNIANFLMICRKIKSSYLNDSRVFWLYTQSGLWNSFSTPKRHELPKKRH